MMTQDIREAKDELLRASIVALQRASLFARETAIRTGTHLVLVQDGKLMRIPAHELRMQLSESMNETPCTYSPSEP
jgi:hypothetical protein